MPALLSPPCSATSSEDRRRHPAPGLWWTPRGKACGSHWKHTALVCTCCPQKAQHCPLPTRLRASEPFRMEGFQHDRQARSFSGRPTVRLCPHKMSHHRCHSWSHADNQALMSQLTVSLKHSTRSVPGEIWAAFCRHGRHNLPPGAPETTLPLLGLPPLSLTLTTVLENQHLRSSALEVIHAKARRAERCYPWRFIKL